MAASCICFVVRSDESSHHGNFRSALCGPGGETCAENGAEQGFMCFQAFSKFYSACNKNDFVYKDIRKLQQNYGTNIIKIYRLN